MSNEATNQPTISQVEPENNDVMRIDWDDRAREDAMYYIVTNAADSLDAFDASAQANMSLFSKAVSQVEGRESILEIGCGIGRLLKPFASQFAQVYGVDVSPEMIERSKEYTKDTPNITTWANDGSSLHPLEDNSIDYVFSYITFQHIPFATVIETYIRETLRVLKPGGIFQFQVAGKTGTREEAEWERSRQRTTWNGMMYSDAEIRALTERIGFLVLDTYADLPDNSCVFQWVVARKPKP